MIHLSLFAPAKVNLDLVITGKRKDGYHTLRSHVAFADVGDDIRVTCEESNAPRVICTLSGPFGAQLQNLDPAENLAVRAAALFLQTHNIAQNIRIELIKNIPSGAGFGGGSADAAALWRGLNETFGKSGAPPLSLGADVPVCFRATACLMEGIGDILSPWEIASQNAILLWPGPGGGTKDLYADHDAAPPSVQDPSGNALQDLAIRRCPAIRDALTSLTALPDCSKAQLSGSGTAVFGLLKNPVKDLPVLPFPWVQGCLIGNVTKPLVTIQR